MILFQYLSHCLMDEIYSGYINDLDILMLFSYPHSIIIPIIYHTFMPISLWYMSQTGDESVAKAVQRGHCLNENPMP